MPFQSRFLVGCNYHKGKTYANWNVCQPIVGEENVLICSLSSNMCDSVVNNAFFFKFMNHVIGCNMRQIMQNHTTVLVWTVILLVFSN